MLQGAIAPHHRDGTLRPGVILRDDEGRRPFSGMGLVMDRPSAVRRLTVSSAFRVLSAQTRCNGSSEGNGLPATGPPPRAKVSGTRNESDARPALAGSDGDAIAPSAISLKINRRHRAGSPACCPSLIRPDQAGPGGGWKSTVVETPRYGGLARRISFCATKVCGSMIAAESAA
jgi:hypothetical protein